MPLGRSHNVVVNEEKNYAVAVGAVPRDSTCASGLVFINMDDPAEPYSPGCSPQDGYIHDAQCIVVSEIECSLARTIPLTWEQHSTVGPMRGTMAETSAMATMKTP